MEMKLRKVSGEEGHVIVERLEMEDPLFESETPHVAHALFHNPKTASFDYGAELYLGKTVGDKVVTSGAKAFTLAAGTSKTVDFSVSTPRLTIPDDSFHVYLEIKHLGVLLITFIGTEDVAVFVTPAVEVTEVTWD